MLLDKRRGRDPEQHLLVKVLEELSEAVVVRFVDHDQPQVFKADALVVQAVVERFHHRHVAPVFLAFFEFFDLAVDDFVGHPNLCEHGGGLAQKLDAVRQNEHALAGFQDVTLGEFRENHRLAAPGGKLVQQVVSGGKLAEARHDLVDRFSLITIEILPFFAVEALGDFGVNGKGFGHGVESSGKAQKYPLDCPV